MKLKLKPKIQDLAAFAFFEGANEVPLEDTLREVQTGHEMERTTLREQSIRRQKPLEATLDELGHVIPALESAWAALVTRLGAYAPAVASAFVIGLSGVVALAVDAILLAPGLDAVGISSPLVQIVAALGFAALSATIFHLAYETFGRREHSLEIAIIYRGLAIVAIFSLLGWGVFRGYEVQFGAALNDNPLGRFLGAHPVLSTIFFCFVTLAAPLVGAAAFHNAIPRIHDWIVWKRTGTKLEGLRKRFSEAERSLEEERSTLEEGLRRLDAQELNWEAIVAQYHRRGATHGARQAPHWLVILKASLSGVIGLAAGCALGSLFAPLYYTVPLAAWVLTFVYYRRVRFHPNYDQFKRQENARFTIRTDGPRALSRSTPEILPPQEARHAQRH